MELLIARGRPPGTPLSLHFKESLISRSFDNQGETLWNPPFPSARLHCKENFISGTFNNQGKTPWNPPLLSARLHCKENLILGPSRQHAFNVKRTSYLEPLITRESPSLDSIQIDDNATTVLRFQCKEDFIPGTFNNQGVSLS